MPCFHPRLAWQAPEGGRLVFRGRPGYVPVEMACQQCIGCRLVKRLSWVVRCLLELRVNPTAIFLTLTYDDEHLPWRGHADVRQVQLFFKRLRRALPGVELRYYGCSEYGGTTGRAHYHFVVYGWRPEDAVEIGDGLYTSQILSRAWGNGFVSFGSVTQQSIAYVASHNVDKVTGDAARKRYSCVDPETGDVYELEPERAFMSRRPGIGWPCVERYLQDFTNVDVDGVRLPGGRVVPMGSYLDAKLEELLPEVVAERKRRRKLAAQSPERQADSTDARLRVREHCAKAKIRGERERRKL